jgi:asparagine synthase (glutamine-hydrolysing)
MSAQYGTWRFDGRPVGSGVMETINALLAPYGPDRSGSFSEEGIDILHRAFNTTKESVREEQPYISSSGSVFTWDGRLDNRDELFAELTGGLVTTETDVQIVVDAYERWGRSCLAKLIGDWALSIYNSREQYLILAKDPIGSRHLYYCFDECQVSWSTTLEPLLRFSHRSFGLCEEYIAGWLACFPAAHLTPYIGIEAVPPASYVAFHPGRRTQAEYWALDPGKRIRYRTDGEYEEHFRSVLAQAVCRRLRAAGPVLAELSGGIDSASIVCMADIVTAKKCPTATVDTMSWYDESDQSRNELPYLAHVEKQRGRKGFHINLTTRRTQREPDSISGFFSKTGTSRFAAVPHQNLNLRPELFGVDLEYMRSKSYRVVLSGIGGEDVSGGYLPTPIPEFHDLLVTGRLFRFVRQLLAWSKAMQRPPLDLLRETLRALIAQSVPFPWASQAQHSPPWIEPAFGKRYQSALRWYSSRIKLFKGIPSFQHQVGLLSHARRFLAFTVLPEDPVREIRYPYLDREFIEFACALPRQQLVGIGKRRFLMKRALQGIVPDEILTRKRRHSSSKTIRTSPLIRDFVQSEMGTRLICSSSGLVNSQILLRFLQQDAVALDPMMKDIERTLLLEAWLQHASTQGVLGVSSAYSKGKQTALSSSQPKDVVARSSV